MTQERKIGQWGERVARVVLSAGGFQILETGAHSRFGELDIVCRDGGVLVGVEVKTRCSQSYGAAREAMSDKKLLKLAKTLSLWQEKYQWAGDDSRLDCLLLEKCAGGYYLLTWIVGVGAEELSDELD